MPDDDEEILSETGAYPLNELVQDGYFRASEPWTETEERVLLQLHQDMRLSTEGISRHLSRAPGAIRYRLKRLLDPAVRKRPGDVPDKDHPLRRVLMGRHPVTGKLLSPDSAWRHPSILNDLPVILRACDALTAEKPAPAKPQVVVRRNDEPLRKSNRPARLAYSAPSDDSVIDDY
ncbi:hypothetical protein [Limimaricola pyoseonensis]|uniref:hypothetical protein n=1 Tax=Limimaricola pyoseonensis TaxID=521013 RepID=UPI001041DB55|nr:hypothetical protein [Limimaricola pyoseonensis]